MADSDGDGAAYQACDIEAMMLTVGRPEPPALIEDIRFKRDYIGAELQEFERRTLAAPQYPIQMLSAPN